MISRIFNKNTKNQYLAIFCANILSISYGTSSGWTSSSVLLLKSNELTPFQENGALSSEQLSWISSLICFGGLIGSIIFGWMVQYMGKKIILILISIPQILSWILIIFSTNAFYLYASRFACGLASGGVFVLIPLFVSEIAEDKVRGTLGSLLMLTANSGILIAFIVGNYLNYVQVACLHLVFPLLFLLLFIFFPDTPLQYIKTNNLKMAEKSLRFYKNIQTNDMEKNIDCQKELESMRNKMEKDFEINGTNKITFDDLFKSKASRKAFFMAFIITSTHELCGVYVMINYTSSIFAESGSNISPNLSAIIVALIQCIGTIVSTKLVDRAGRKFLYGLSLIGAGLSLLVLGTYSYLNVLGYPVQHYSWISIASFSSMFFFASCGIIPLPFVVISELLPEKVRSIGVTINMMYSWGLSFVLVKCFSALSLLIGVHGCIFIFAICNLSAAIFIIFIVPETKGKSYSEILQILES